MGITRGITRSITRPITRGITDPSFGTARPLMIFAFGESNSGGQVANAGAAAWELLSREELDFWNVDDEVFEPLDIGANNNIDHFNLSSTTHAWELGLANRIRERYTGDKVIRYVQAGQGGSKVTDWEVADSYWTKFVARATAAKVVYPDSRFVVWWTLGINDIVATVTPATWKPLAVELISRIKAELPGVKIYMTELMPNSAEKIAYNVTLAEIADADSSVTLVSSAGLATQDSHHWDYQSQKDWSLRFLRAMRPQFGNMGAVDWATTTATQDASGRLAFSAVNQHAHLADPIPLTERFAIFSRHRAGNGFVFAIDTDVNEDNWGGSSDAYLLGWYVVGSDLFVINQDSGTGTTVSGAGADLVRVTKFGNDLILATSSDGGLNWVNRVTRAILSGLTEVRVKALQATSNSSSADLWISTTAVEPEFVYLLDEYPDAVTAYSLRKLREAYSGDCIRVRRSSDSTELDIGFANNVLDISALLTFCSAGDGFVVTWYDQKGSFDATQSDTADQPQIVSSGSVIVNEHGKPTVHIVDSDGASVQQHLNFANWHANTQTYVGMFSCYSILTNGIAPPVLETNPSDRGFISLHLSSSREARTGTVRSGLLIGNGTVIPTSTTTIRHDYADRSRIRTYLNTTEATDIDIADNNANFNMPTNYMIGNANLNAIQSSVKISEMIFFVIDQAADQLAIRTNMREYWT